MENINETQIKEFILLGFSYRPQTKIILFVVLLAVYLINLTANSFFIAVCLADAHLHSPMYFFLCNLSALDLCFSSASSITILEGLLVQRVKVTFSLCIAQMYICLSFGGTEYILLTVMAWDRYVAICKPLNYQQIMTKGVCTKLAIVTWAGGFAFPLSSVVTLPWVHFCGHYIVDHTLCEADALSQLTCMDSQFSKFNRLFQSFLTLVAPVSVILFTYCRIISTILKMTTESRSRAFATCGSHLMAVVLFYGTAMTVYMRPKSTGSREKDKLLTLFYVLVVPALNPFIYTLRNAEVKGAFKKLYVRIFSGQRFRA